MIFLVLFFFQETVDWDKVYRDAHVFYQNEDYQSARDTYAQMTQAGIQDPDLFYNLGNAHFKLGELGRAALAYYRALKWDPNHADARHNLQLVNQLRQDPPIEGELESPFLWLQVLVLAIPFGVLFWSTVLLFSLSGLCGLRLVLGSFSRPLAYVLVFGCLFGMLLGYATYAQHAHFHRQDLAVVIKKKVNVMAGPSQSEARSFEIHEAIRVQILDTRGEWLRVRLANGFNGWVPQSSIAII